MKTDPIILKIQQELKQHATPEHAVSMQRWFKEELNCLGVKTPIVRAIGRTYWKEIKHRPKKEIFVLCEQLLMLRVHEARTIAFQWAYGLKGQYEQEKDFAVFESWLKKYVSDWSACDDLCCKPLGALLFQYPQLLQETFAWTKSRNRWIRRAAAVSLIYTLRKGLYTDQPMKIADALLTDEDDMVQKGYGWMLKEWSEFFPQDVFDYVMKRKNRMPRTALRYAIEKLPAKMKAQAMKTT